MRKVLDSLLQNIFLFGQGPPIKWNKRKLGILARLGVAPQGYLLPLGVGCAPLLGRIGMLSPTAFSKKNILISLECTVVRWGHSIFPLWKNSCWTMATNAMSNMTLRPAPAASLWLMRIPFGALSFLRTALSMGYGIPAFPYDIWPYRRACGVRALHCQRDGTLSKGVWSSGRESKRLCHNPHQTMRQLPLLRSNR